MQKDLLYTLHIAQQSITIPNMVLVVIAKNFSSFDLETISMLNALLQYFFTFTIKQSQTM